MEQFENLNETLEAPVERSAAEVEKKKGKDKLKELKNEVYSKLENEAEYREKFKSKCAMIHGVNSLGWTDKGGFIANPDVPAKGPDGKRPENGLLTTSGIVGYTFKNVSDVPFTYTTEEYALNADGVYVGTQVQKTAKPGEVFVLSKKYAAFNFSAPEFSFQLGNGKFIRGGKAGRVHSIDEELERYYFKFEDSNLKINSDELKIQIGKQVKDKATGEKKWVVKDEFVQFFGFLNNEIVKKPAAGRKREGSAVTDSDAKAYYIQKLLQDQSRL